MAKRKMRKGGGGAKGSAFERVICKRLSLWWTDGERDDVFWRTHASGARATARAKRGKKTHGQYGDICYVDPIGKPLLDSFTFSLKSGYNRETLHDLFDAPKTAKEQTWLRWIREVRRDAELAGSDYWAIIAQRTRREAIVVIPTRNRFDTKNIGRIWVAGTTPIDVLLLSDFLCDEILSIRKDSHA